MLEEKIEKNLLGKIRATAGKYIEVYLLVGGLALGAVGGCGPETEKCALPTSSEYYVGMNYCPNYWGYGTKSWADGCSNNQQCVCEKPEGEPDDKCECRCEDKPKPYEPHDKW